MHFELLLTQQSLRNTPTRLNLKFQFLLEDTVLHRTSQKLADLLFFDWFDIFHVRILFIDGLGLDRF